jgi:hypothetical protein
MDTTVETAEVRLHWREVLKEQGRTMTWLSLKTETSYPMLKSYAAGITKPPQAWLDKVSVLLGVPVR